MISDKKILHVFDPAIISQSTIELFNKLDFSQRYVVITSHPEKWEEISSRISNICLIDPNKEDIVEVLGREISNADIIIAQALSYEKAKAIAKNKDKSKVFIWGLWGYGLYNISEYFGKKKDSTDYSTVLKRKESLFGKIKEYYTFKVIYKQAVQKLDICLFLLESDYKLLGEAIPHRAVWRTTCYQTINNLIGPDDFKIDGTSILLGNSSTPSNRHEAVFEELKKSNSEKKIIVPLTYGDDKYRAQIIKSGSNYFGNRLTPLTEFKALNDYNDLVKSCSHVIMAHERQQGFGTIMTVLYGGAKLFLSEKSPLYGWLQNIGIKVFSVESHLSFGLEQKLPPELQRLNRNLVKQYLSEDLITKQITDILVEACQISKMKLSEKAKS